MLEICSRSIRAEHVTRISMTFVPITTFDEWSCLSLSVSVTEDAANNNIMNAMIKQSINHQLELLPVASQNHIQAGF